MKDHLKRSRNFYIKDFSESSNFLGQRGQAVLEYVLLLTASVAIAALIVNVMSSRNPEDPGYVVEKWQKIIKTIGDDVSESSTPSRP